LGWQGTPCLHQYGVGDLLQIAVSRRGYRGWLMTGCMLVGLLGTEAVRRPGLLSGWHDAYVLGKSLVDNF
jgi:hypothetical protein